MSVSATSVVSTTNTVQTLVSPSNEITFRPIGYIETTFDNKRAVPRQPSVLKNLRGVIVIDTNVLNNPDHALNGLEEFSHVWYVI